jgi:ATP-dependent DNA ligase
MSYWSLPYSAFAWRSHTAGDRASLTRGFDTKHLLSRFSSVSQVRSQLELPEARPGRWRAGLTAAKMKECRWVKPVLVGQFEFTEWTPDNHLRHSSFITLWDDKGAKSVVRQGS